MLAIISSLQRAAKQEDEGEDEEEEEKEEAAPAARPMQPTGASAAERDREAALEKCVEVAASSPRSHTLLPHRFYLEFASVDRVLLVCSLCSGFLRLFARVSRRALRMVCWTTRVATSRRRPPFAAR